MKFTSLIGAGTVSIVLWAPLAGAQVLQRPPRQIEPLFGQGQRGPNATRHDVTVEANALGGYDDNLGAPAPLVGVVPPNPSAYVANLDLSTRYSLRSGDSSLSLNGRGYMNTFRNVGLTPSYGGDESMQVQTGLGRKTTVRLTQGVSYSPYLSLGSFGSLNGSAGSFNPNTTLSNALGRGPSWTRTLAPSFSRQWTRTASMRVGYSYDQKRYVSSPAFNSQTHGGFFQLDQAIGRSLQANGSYRATEGHYSLVTGGTRTAFGQHADGGLTYSRRVSPTRQVSLSGGAGAVYTDTVNSATLAPVRYWAPSAYGSAHVDIARSWSLSGNYRRATTVLQGLTPDTYLTHSATVSVGGGLVSSLQIVAATSYSNGRAGNRTQADERFNAYTGTVQVGYMVTSTLAAVASVNHYRYVLNERASLSLGVQPRTVRNSVRVGLSWSLPIYR